MRPLELTLTGFKGVRSGLNRDSVTINLRSYKGLVAFVGDNGRGKSTIKGNLHPYRIMPDRVKKYSPKGFSYYEECYGSDARKELLFEISGNVYRSLVLIDAVRRKQEAYLYQQDGEGQWQVFANTQDGKLDVYDTAVEDLVGTPRMFFTSIFRSQKAPALSSYTRGEMMDIFAELIQVDEHKEKKETAGDVADALLLRKKGLATELTNLQLSLNGASQKQVDKAKAEERLSVISSEVSGLDDKVKKAEGDIKALEITESLQTDLSKRREKLAQDTAGKEKQVLDLRTAVTEKRAAAKTKYDEKFAAKQKADARLLQVVADMATVEGRMKVSGEALKALEIKETLQADAQKRREKLTQDVSYKEKQKGEVLSSITQKKVLYNQKHKEKKGQHDAAKALADRADDLQKKSAEEVSKAASVSSVKERLQAVEGQLSTYSGQLREIGVTETQLKETESALQKLRLARQHAVETADTALRRAQESVKTLDDGQCVFPDKAPTCKFVKGAISDRESLPSLAAALEKAQVPDPQEKVLEAEITRLTASVAIKGTVETQEKEAVKQKESLGKELETTEKVLETLRQALKDLSKVEEAKVSLPLLAKELADILSEGKGVISDLEKQGTLLEKEIEALQLDLKGISVDETLPAEIKSLRESVEADKASLETLRKEDATLRGEIGSLADIQSILTECEAAVKEIEKQVAQLVMEIEALQSELKGIAVDETLPAEIKRLRESVEADKSSLEILRKEEATLRVMVGSLSEVIKQIELAKERIAVLASEVEALDRDISEWQVLEKAMEGIITLEIDDAGPTVTAITNDILLSCYGPRFSVNIKTQDAKVGGDKDMKEVFDIVVYDSQRNESKSLSVMSGGEETWIDDAITRGISLFNASRGGVNYQLLFSDEKDGRLTEEKKKEFMAVKRRVLELGGFLGEYFISHTKEIQEMADAVIDLEELVAEPSQRAAAESSQGVLV
ncbi:MAG: hypothetical protein C0402_05380 [Thermodesulfovibrio sp.]|nr:hypothetical protein [Thermodesulfovibrio sp.]